MSRTLNLGFCFQFYDAAFFGTPSGWDTLGHASGSIPFMDEIAPFEGEAAGGVSRLMGLDIGDRRIGVAVSDPLGMTAQPVLTLVRTNRRQDLKSLKRLVRKYGCGEIVVGNPLYMSGDQSPQAAKAQSFAEILRKETGLVVHLWDERLTTTEAHRHLHAAGRAAPEHRAVVDQVAAVLILQSFLDARRALEKPKVH